MIPALDGPKRPVLRWHGGKWKLAPWIIGHFPPHRVYVEPFGGAASILFRKPRAYAEVYNDLDQEVVNLFRVLQDEKQNAALLRLLELTPFAREEFNFSASQPKNAVERARFLIIRAFMGFGSNAHSGRVTGFRSNSSRSGTTPAHDWANYTEVLPSLISRLRGVVVENRDACEVMAQHDSAETLHYVDPPYIAETRSPANKQELKHRMYRHELTDNDHVHLLTFLRGLEGMVLLSGYPHALYDNALPDWKRVEVAALADGARKRTEVLWINPICAAALERLHAGAGAPLFAHVEGLNDRH